MPSPDFSECKRLSQNQRANEPARGFVFNSYGKTFLFKFKRVLILSAILSPVHQVPIKYALKSLKVCELMDLTGDDWLFSIGNIQTIKYPSSTHWELCRPPRNIFHHLRRSLRIVGKDCVCANGFLDQPRSQGDIPGIDTEAFPHRTVGQIFPVNIFQSGMQIAGPNPVIPVHLYQGPVR